MEELVRPRANDGNEPIMMDWSARQSDSWPAIHGDLCDRFTVGKRVHNCRGFVFHSGAAYSDPGKEEKNF